MSEFDTINAKLDRLLEIAARGEAVLPDTPPVPMPHPEAPAPAPHPQATPTMTDLLFRPSESVGAVLDARVEAARGQFDAQPVEAVPTLWANRTVLANVAGGVTYTIVCPPGRGYTVAGRTGGYDARFNGVVGSATLVADGTGLVYLTVDKACEAVFVPV